MSKYISDTLNMTMNENDTTFEMELNKVKPKTMKHIYEFMKQTNDTDVPELDKPLHKPFDEMVPQW